MIILKKDESGEICFMAEKPISERMGIAETKIEDLESRADQLEKSNEEKKNWLLKQLTGAFKLVTIVTVLSFLTEMAKEGCRLCKVIIGYFTGANQ